MAQSSAAVSNRSPKSVPPKSSKKGKGLTAAQKRRQSSAQLMLISGGQPAGMPEQPKPFAFQARASKISRNLMGRGLDVVIVSPTGSGKTVMAGLTVQGVPADEVMAVSHSNALCDQLAERLCPQSVTVQGVLAGWRPVKPPRIIIWDESHHSEGEVWRTLRTEIFPKAQLLGLTPCPQRSDGRALAQFDELVQAATYSELLELGIIVPCKVSGPEAIYGDKRPDPVKAYLKGAAGKKTILFLPDTTVADECTKQLTRHKIAVGSYHSNMPRGERKALFSKFRTGEIMAICTVHALSEGIDVPDAQVGILAQRCESMSLYINSVGRILRSAPGKREAHLIDLTGASLRHGNPCTDHDFSLFGAGVYRKEDREPVERGEVDRTPLPTYDAKLVTWYDVKWPTQDDKRRQMGWLRRHAQANGYGEETADTAFRALFGGRAEAAQ